MKTRILAPIVLVAIALAGCSEDEPVDFGAAPTSAAAAPSSAAAAPSSAAPSPVPSNRTSASTAGCPVTVTVLEKAFKASAEVAGAIVLGKGLKDVSCYQGWATAVTQPTGVDPAVVLFKYDAAKKTWVAQSGGTDGICMDAVPADIQTHLKGCQN